MHQLTCGVDEKVWIDGYCLEILQVADGIVRFGVSVPVAAGRPMIPSHEIRLPAQGAASRLEDASAPSPPAVNEVRNQVP